MVVEFSTEITIGGHDDVEVWVVAVGEPYVIDGDHTNPPEHGVDDCAIHRVEIQGKRVPVEVIRPNDLESLLDKAEAQLLREYR